MKKQLRRYISLVLTFALISALFAAPVAAKNQLPNESSILIMSGDDMQVEITEELIADGRIIRQYENGTLTTEVDVTEGSDVLVVNTLDANQDIIESESISISSVALLPGASPYAITSLGTINYATSDGAKSIKIKYDSQVYQNANYAVLPGTYTLAGVVSIIVALLACPGIIAGEIASWIIAGLGFGGAVANLVFPRVTLTCKRSDYTYYLTNGSNSAHTNDFMCKSYYITDDTPEHSNYQYKTFYDGWSPATAWNDVSFAQRCFLSMFDSVSYAVNSWVRG